MKLHITDIGKTIAGGRLVSYINSKKVCWITKDGEIICVHYNSL